MTNSDDHSSCVDDLSSCFIESSLAIFYNTQLRRSSGMLIFHKNLPEIGKVFRWIFPPDDPYFRHSESADDEPCNCADPHIFPLQIDLTTTCLQLIHRADLLFNFHPVFLPSVNYL